MAPLLIQYPDSGPKSGIFSIPLGNGPASYLLPQIAGSRDFLAIQAFK
jgi:hypothetical protein